MIKLKSLINKSFLLKEDDIVKNKKTGNVYTVQQMDPNKHDKATPDEIEKTKAKSGGVIPKVGQEPSTPKPGANPQAKPQQTTSNTNGKNCADCRKDKAEIESLRRQIEKLKEESDKKIKLDREIYLSTKVSDHEKKNHN